MYALPPAPVAAAQHKLRLVRHVHPFIELSDLAKADVDGVLAAVGLTRADLRVKNTELPNYKLFWMVEQLVAQCGDPEIGLRAAERMLLTRSEFLGNAIRHILEMTSDLMTVFQLLAHFGTHVCANMSITLHTEGELVTSTVVPYVDPPYEVIDSIAGAFCNLTQVLGGPRLRPIVVRLPRPRPARPERWEKALDAPVEFDAPRFETVYAREALRGSVRTEAAAPAAAVPMLAAQSGNALALQIRAHVLARLAEGVPLLASVARKLGMSARTLRRRLAEVRSSYAELVDEARRERALALAGRAELDVGRLAELTGFTDASAFARAFRRWTGERPHAYMRRLREAGAPTQSAEVAE